MGLLLAALRLVLADLRRHRVQAVVLLVSITVSTALLSLGGALGGATGALYRHTRAATAGPDLVGILPGAVPATDAALRGLDDAPGVVAHGGPYRRYFTTLTAHGSTVRTVVESAAEADGPMNHPLVTSGSWARPGGVVVERGFAGALGVRVGDRITVAGRARRVAGIAVTAAVPVYPWAQMGGPYGGPSDDSGLVWLAPPDVRPLAAARVPVASALYLKLRDPGTAQAFLEDHRDPAVRVNFFTWQFLAVQDDNLLNDLQPITVVGSWLLGLVAVAGLATLVAGRAARQTRRVGLLKAVGATPGLIAAVLFAEYLVLALLGDALGLTAARLAGPALVNPSNSLLTTATGPTGGVVAVTSLLALAMATLTTAGPTLRALRTETVAALADTGRRPEHRPRLTAVSALLPTPLLLGLRLIARRPGRAVLHACSTAATQTGIVFLLMEYAHPTNGYDLGGTVMTDLRIHQGRHVLLVITGALVALALVNTVTITWTTATEARPTLAIARTLGATPGQVTAGLSAAQLLPTVPGVAAGMSILTLALASDHPSMPPTWSLLTVALAPLVLTALLAAVPAHIASRVPVARALAAEG